MSSPELPYERRGGDDQLVQMHNRVAALERIKYLTGVDLRERSTEYKQLIDCELYVRWYKNLPANTPIDEIWCQRVSEIVRTLEKEKKEVLEKAMEAAPERAKQLYTESKHNVPLSPSPKPLTKKEANVFTKFINALHKKYFPKKV